LAIVQISQITNRKGLAVDLPQLAGAELGWSIDTRQLYIGNGTLAEGAPVIGNTEILTEFSDIVNLAAFYTYKGTAAGYTVQTGPTPGDPVVLSLQSWLDQYASVKDFGATGDGVTDDTDAINRALYQLYCRQANPQIRRSLYFPAGVYKVSGSINIPPYATLIGEGPNNSIIQLTTGTGTDYVAQTADSQQNTGINIGTNGATAPTGITISGMAFQSLDSAKNIFLVQAATECTFSGVSFFGPGTTSTLNVDTAGTMGVTFGSQLALITKNIVFESCAFSGTTYGVSIDQQTKGVVINNSAFNILYQGVALGIGTIVNGGPTGTKITNNVFDNIFAEGIIIGDVNLNATGYNIFYDVADSFLGLTNPTASCIVIQGDNNVSIGDMFARSDIYSTSYPRVNIGSSVSIATTNGNQLQLGTLTLESSLITTIYNNRTVYPLFTVDIGTIGANSFKTTYSITRGATHRTGTLWVSSAGVSALNYMDDYTENTNCGVTLTVSQVGSTITVSYTTSNIGINGQMSYQISYQN
jgi:Pectate lyase superfamily protein